MASSSSTRHSRRRSRKQGLPPCDLAELAGADNADIERTDPDGYDDDNADEQEMDATAKQRRRRNRAATKKSQRKKKRLIEGLERYEQVLSAIRNTLREEKEILRTEALYLREQILQHRDCGFDLIDGYIEASARRLTIVRECREEGRREGSDGGSGRASSSDSRVFASPSGTFSDRMLPN
jgi:hypothetical protein